MQVISFGAFSRVVRAGDARRFKIDLKGEREKILKEAATEALTQPPILKPYSKTKIRGKDCISYQRYEDHLVVRSIGLHIRRRLRVRTQDRNLAIRGLIETLTEGGEYSVVRRDIADFYELIDVTALKARLLTDPTTTPRVREFLSRFFLQHCATGIGLPRGIGLSAILSELYMQDFDRKVRAIPGVFRYFRYADDIIVITSRSPTALESAIGDALPTGMSFNDTKSSAISVRLDDTESRDIEYLGYAFKILPPEKKKLGRHLSVAISPKKIRRAKSRVVLSVKAFLASGDAALLIDRITFLTSNYEVRRNGASAIAGATHVRSGIYYNYFHCGTYSIDKKGIVVRGEPQCAELKSLDGFLRSALRQARAHLQPMQRDRLSKLSFFQGFRKRMLMRVPPHRVGEIKMVWRNV